MFIQMLLLITWVQQFSIRRSLTLLLLNTYWCYKNILLLIPIRTIVGNVCVFCVTKKVCCCEKVPLFFESVSHIDIKGSVCFTHTPCICRVFDLMQPENCCYICFIHSFWPNLFTYIQTHIRYIYRICINLETYL